MTCDRLDEGIMSEKINRQGMVRFCFGASGAGKSRRLMNEVIRGAEDALGHFTDCGNPEGLPMYLYVVPEQFTLETQKDLVLSSGNQGILNIDVLSFGRLSHRIFEELGADSRAVLDDLGKSLVLRRAAQGVEDQLTVLKGRLDRLNMISEVKSSISEFMQYDLSVDDVRELSAYAASHGQKALAMQLSDLALLYEAFLQYKKDSFLTGEETLDLLAEAIPSSALVKRSVIVFDGFTGFTPVQYRVLEQLMRCAREVIFSLTIAEDGGPSPALTMEQGVPADPRDLFYLSRKTLKDLLRLADEAGAAHGEDLYCGSAGTVNGNPPQAGSASAAACHVPYRFRGRPALAHLECHLFRYPAVPFTPAQGSAGESRTDAADAIRLIAASDPEQEVRQTMIDLKKAVMQGTAYREIGIVCGDLSGYEDLIRRLAEVYEVPVYIDTTRNVLHNPLTEMIRAALTIAAGDWSYEAVFRFLRSGMTPLTDAEIDRLENYCLKHGIRTRKRWETAADEDVEPARERFLACIAPLTAKTSGTAAERTRALYTFLTAVGAGERCQAFAEQSAASGDPVHEKEYSQIYAAILHLMDQVYELCGEEKISAGDYQELMEAGFGEIRLGTLPQQADRVLAGDMERTRLQQVRILFFLGANDGNIPGNTARGGLIADPDREFLKRSGRELSPTPREQMYIQHLYLYLNMTKPTERLCVSWSERGADGASLRPSYLVSQLRGLFPGAAVEHPSAEPMRNQLVSGRDAFRFLAESLRRYADGRMESDPEGQDFPALYTALSDPEGGDPERVQKLARAAFLRYKPQPLERAAADALYRNRLRGSVSSMETAAKCLLRAFLQYGLCLKEREVYSIASADTGSILHGAIERFSEKLLQQGLAWDSFSEEQGERLAAQSLKEAAADYHNELIYDTARGVGMLHRMERVLYRTVDTLQYQLRQGVFVPTRFEVPFGEHNEWEMDLGEGRILSLSGKIDRVDLARHADREYIKIVDYKSGSQDLEPEDIRKGLRLQLMVYMEAEIARERLQNPGKQILPAAMLYYRFDDPILAESVRWEAGKADPESRKEASVSEIRKHLCPAGMVSSDADTLSLLAGDPGNGAKVIPVTFNRDGSPRKSEHLFTQEEYESLAAKVRALLANLGGSQLGGSIDANPVKTGNRKTACTYCPMKESCGYDPKTPGYRFRDS